MAGTAFAPARARAGEARELLEREPSRRSGVARPAPFVVTLTPPDREEISRGLAEGLQYKEIPGDSREDNINITRTTGILFRQAPKVKCYDRLSPSALQVAHTAPHITACGRCHVVPWSVIR